jgi:hypothetical protein
MQGPASNTLVFPGKKDEPKKKNPALPVWMQQGQ